MIYDIRDKRSWYIADCFVRKITFFLYDVSNRPGQFVKMMVALNIEFLSSSYYFSIIHPIQGINISQGRGLVNGDVLAREGCILLGYVG